MIINKIVAGAICTVFSSTGAWAGGIDLSGQPIGALFKPGSYAEFTYAFIKPDVRGTDFSGASTGNIGNDLSTSTLSYKTDLTNSLSLALIYDQPYGRSSNYNEGALAGISSELVSNAITLPFRYKMNQRWSVHAGVRVQDFDTTVILPALGYELQNSKQQDAGYLVGVSFEIPEYFTLVSLTYNSEISHDFNSVENGVRTESYTYATPESLNLDVRMPISNTTLVFGSLRYAAYEGGEVVPPAYLEMTGTPLVKLEDDIMTYSLGVGQKFNDNWSGFARFRYEASEDVTQDPFNPVDGFRSYGLGVNYVYKKLNLTLGVDYAEFGDTSGVVGEFRDVSATVGGLALGYTF